MDFPQFNPGLPFPIGYDLIRPGFRLSGALKVYPRDQYKHKLYELGYQVYLDLSIFSSISFGFSGSSILNEDKDPVISQVSLHIRDNDLRQQVAHHITSAFALHKSSIRLGGAVTEWENIGGYLLQVSTEKYPLLNIRKTETPQSFSMSQNPGNLIDLSSAQAGDISVGHVAGRDIHITINTYNLPPKIDENAESKDDSIKQ